MSKLRALMQIALNKQREQRKPGKPPHVDWGYLRESFIEWAANRPLPFFYGDWITTTQWLRLNSYGPRSQGVLHPSAGLSTDAEVHGCLRNKLFDMMRAEQSTGLMDPALFSWMDVGTNRHVGFHVLFLGMAAHNWMGVESVRFEERLTHPTLPLSGSFDVIVRVKGWDYVLDLKTIGSEPYKALNGRPKPTHHRQMMTYLHLSGVRAGYLIYENKNNQFWYTPLEQMRVDYVEKEAKDIEAFCVDMVRRLKRKKLPEFDQDTCDANIKFCAYRKVCAEDREGAAFGVIDRRHTGDMKYYG